MAHEGGRTLRSEDELSHYRIVGPLGAGGMGEVYLAQDRSLERNVALKILPPDLVRSEDRVRRFRLEAKSASSLSHPNIVTIYEIGEDAVRSPGLEPSSSVHYISMELVNGKTLSNLIHEDRTDLRTLLGWLAQAADGLAKAHGVGIVHRDLKPGNIMVTNDGFAKVLDFGLAKLTERSAGAADASATGGPALTQDATGIGVIVGTVGYMAPEQVAGKSVDHRADIFSFGCILYEAATRRAPFAAETSIETMHRILNEKPAPIEEINPQVPAELRRLIRRCLAKNPEQRLQSMKDLALELREIVDDYDALSASASSGSLAGASAVGLAAAKQRGPSPVLLGIGALVVLALAGGAWWALSRGGKTARPEAFASMRMTTVTSRGDVRDCALSADGRYLAYLAGSAGAITLRVRQVATGSDVEVVPPSPDQINTPSFSPDGNYLFFRQRRRDVQSYSALYQVPSLGGTPQERVFDVDSRATFAPDGKRLLFWRGRGAEGGNRLVEFDLDASKERVVTEVKFGEFPTSPPAWSPDGKQIASALFSPERDLTTTIALFDPVTGKRRDHVSLPRTQIFDLSWLVDGSGFAICAQDYMTMSTPQVLLVGYPGKAVQRVTNDFQAYRAIGAAGGEEALASVRQTRLSNLWTVDVAGGTPRQLTRAANPENSPGGLAVADSATLVYHAPRDEGLPLWSIPVAGGEPRRLTSGRTFAVNPVAAGGRVIFDRLGADGIHVWSVKPDGTELTQVTTGSGEQHRGATRDGRWLGFGRYTELRVLRFLAMPAMTEGLVLPEAGISDYTKDGTKALVSRVTRDERGLQRFMLRLQPLDGSAARDSILLPGDATIAQLSPDERGVDFLSTSDPAANLMRLPFGGGTPAPVTRFASGRLTDYVRSPDGARLAIVVRVGAGENIWMANADGSGARQLTQFEGQEIFEIRWVDGGMTLAFGAGTITTDVVLVRDFR